MSLADFLPRSAILASIRASSKKQLLLEIAERAAPLAGLDARAVFDSLLQRERLGSTGIGNGIAIPHGKFETLARLCGFFVRLDKPIDFDAVDGQPVDMLFVLLAPEHAGADHLKALSRVARALRNQPVMAQLRATRDPDVLHAILTQAEYTRAA
jgi:PTS system nitrogen regulatory IIA component